MNGPRRVFAPDGTLKKEKMYGQYSYLIFGCELAITMKSPKRAVIEIFYVDEDHLNSWNQFTLTNTDKWLLADIKQKNHENDKWRNDTL